MRSVDAVDAQADGVGVCGDRMAGGVTCELFVLFEARLRVPVPLMIAHPAHLRRKVKLRETT